MVHPVPLDPTGCTGPTRGAASGPRWRRTSKGFYVPSGVDASLPEQRVVEAAALLPSGGFVTGWAALRIQGAAYLDGTRPDARRLPVALVVGPGKGRRSRPGVELLQDRLSPVRLVHDTPCAPVRRALFDEMRRSNLREAVVAMDMVAAARLMSVTRMRSYAESHPGWNGVPVVRAALELADEDSDSPPESRLRLIWLLDAGLPRPLVNAPVFDRSGRLLGYPDLLDEEAGLVVEYDGEDHRRAARHTSDVTREATFRRAHLEVTRVTGPDLRDRAKVVARLVEARRRARFEPPSRRPWTLEKPPWWREPPSVDLELDWRGEPD